MSKSEMIARNRPGLLVIAIVSIIVFVAVGLSWNDSFWSCITFSALLGLGGLLALYLVKNLIAGGYIAFLMIVSGLFVLDSSSIVPFLLLILAMVASFFGLLIGVAGAIFYPEVRKGFFQLSGFSLLIVPVCFTTFNAQDHISNAALDARAKSLTPLVNAIESHQSQKGFPPISIDDLVPDYLNGVYFQGLNHGIRYEVVHGTWQLSATCTNGLRSFDTVYYRPTHEYSDLFGDKIRGGFFAAYEGP